VLGLWNAEYPDIADNYIRRGTLIRFLSLPSYPTHHMTTVTVDVKVIPASTMPFSSFFKSSRKSGAQGESSLPTTTFGIATDTNRPTVTLQGGPSTKHFYNEPEIPTKGIAILTFNGEPNMPRFGGQTVPWAPPAAREGDATVIFRVAVLENGVDKKALADLDIHCDRVYTLPEGYLASHYAYMSSGRLQNGWTDTWAFSSPRK
jgi:hypothetical protein